MYSNETLNNWRKDIEKWGNRVGIYDKTNGSNLLNQKVKFWEEYGELAKGLLKNNDSLIKDSIGDAFVCLVHAHKFLHDKELMIMKWRIDEYSTLTLKEMFDAIPQYIAKGDFNSAVTILVMMSHKYTNEPFECIQIAYNEIKDREGRMIRGTFVKKSDLVEAGTWDN